MGLVLLFESFPFQIVTIQLVAGEERKTAHCNYSGVLHMRERDMRSVLVRTWAGRWRSRWGATG